MFRFPQGDVVRRASGPVSDSTGTLEAASTEVVVHSDGTVDRAPRHQHNDHFMDVFLKGMLEVLQVFKWP